MVKDNSLNQIIGKYSLLSYYPEGDVVLEPKAALSMLEELKDLEVGILGVDTWIEKNGNIVQDIYQLDLSDLCNQVNGVIKSYRYSEQFIKSDLDQAVKYVSLVIDEEKKYFNY